MNAILFYSIPIVVIIVLFVLPLIYCIRRGSFRDGFRFTWWTWAIGLFVFGLSMPGYCALGNEVTGEHFVSEGMIAGMGILLGWLPAFIVASFGRFIYSLTNKTPKDVVYNQNYHENSSDI